MRKLVIDNIGPIGHVDLNLKRVNVIIGPQSAGKSCILKIACFCAWAEKRIQLEQGRNGFEDVRYVEENLIEFHKLGEFFEHGKGSKFRYETEHLWLCYDFDNREEPFSWDWKKNGHWKYKRSQVSYIPAERNLIAAIPNWMEVTMPFDYVRSFISDWSMTRQFYGENSGLNVLNLGVCYYYDKQSGKDYVVLKNGKRLPLSNGSSGLQSAIPMLAYLDYLFINQYKGDKVGSISRESENEEILNRIFDKKFKKGLTTLSETESPYIGQFDVGKRKFKSEAEYRECKKLYDAYTLTWNSDIYLEEPELNLFPKTQLDLISLLLSKSKVHGDSLFIATHSPYVLYALNNCMLGGLVEREIRKTEIETYSDRGSWIPPKDVAVWEMRGDVTSLGMESGVMPLQDEDGLIRGNYFDRIMMYVMSDFKNLSAYYE